MNKIKTIIITLFLLTQISSSYAVDLTEDTTFSSTVTTQQVVTTDDVDIIVTNNASIERTGQKAIKNTDEEVTGTTLTIHSGSSVTSTGNNTISTEGGELTITNSGTIQALGASGANSKAINLSGSDGGITITNNSGGIIASPGNTILATSGTGGDNTTIENSGQIKSTNTSTASSAIIFKDNDTGNTITNNAGGEITSKGTKATIIVGASSTITNSGTIKNNKSVDKNAIQLKGDNNTLTLKDEGIVVGIIKAANGTTGNMLKINHGVGKSYYYKTGGDFTLQDLDNNQIVNGSAGSVGQGGSEILDDLLSTKSLNIRQSLSKYKNSEESSENKNWGEINFSSFKRKQNDQDLSLGFNSANLAINFVSPNQGKDFILSFGAGNQKFTKDHTIDRYSMHLGSFFRDQPIINKFGDEIFVLGGINLHNGKRGILTNTRTTGKLDLTDAFESYELLAGTKKNNNFLIPNIGTTIGLSFTPSHTETEFYHWGDKTVSNLSIYLDDNYKLNLSKNYKLNLGWILDVRKMILGKKQDYKINGSNATYTQNSNLTRELTLATNLGLEKKISDDHFLIFYLDNTVSTQELSSFSGNFAYKFAF